MLDPNDLPAGCGDRRRKNRQDDRGDQQARAHHGALLGVASSARACGLGVGAVGLAVVVVGVTVSRRGRGGGIYGGAPGSSSGSTDGHIYAKYSPADTTNPRNSASTKGSQITPRS